MIVSTICARTSNPDTNFAVCLLLALPLRKFCKLLLLYQAKVNILSGRYPVTNADAETLGGYLARIEFGKFDLNVHKVGFFK